MSDSQDNFQEHRRAFIGRHGQVLDRMNFELSELANNPAIDVRDFNKAASAFASIASILNSSELPDSNQEMILGGLNDIMGKLHARLRLILSERGNLDASTNQLAEAAWKNWGALQQAFNEFAPGTNQTFHDVLTQSGGPDDPQYVEEHHL